MRPGLNVRRKFLERHAPVMLAVLWISTSLAWTMAAAGAAAQAGTLDPSQPPGSGQQAYLPLVARFIPKTVPLAGDLLIDAVENTQSVQNTGNKVPLISGKATVIRVYTRTTSSTPVTGVTISLTATRNNKVLAGSPLVMGPGWVANYWSRGEINTSFNVTLPAEWLYGEVSLAITVDSANYYHETNENNTVFTVNLRFVDMPPLVVKVVPIQYYDPPSGLTFAPPSSDFIAPALLRIYPVSAVNLTRREQINFGQDLTNVKNWQELLKRISELKRADGSPIYEVYYGLIPTAHSSGVTWFNSGLIGLGWMGTRISIGLTDINQDGIVISAADIAGHEIGHNFGRDHSPCAVYPYDKKYPYHGGSIGQYGLDTGLMQVLSPDVYTDIMGYCPTRWVSDYTYAGLYLNQLDYGGPLARVQSQRAPGLLVRATLDENGAVQVDPFYQFSGEIDPPALESPYRLEYLDEAGARVAAYPLAELYAQEAQVSLHSIITLVPLPDKPYVAVRLSRQDPVTGVSQTLAEKPLSLNTLSRPATPSLQADDARLVLTWGTPQVPALVRYSSDGGQQWTTVALDAPGGYLTLERSALPTGDLLFEIVLADSNTIPYRLEWRNPP